MIPKRLNMSNIHFNNSNLKNDKNDYSRVNNWRSDRTRYGYEYVQIIEIISVRNVSNDPIGIFITVPV